MALTDVSILNWKDDFTAEDSNLPRNSDKILQMLDDQVRLIMSVVRAEAENKGWIREGLLATFISATSFSLPDDQRLVASVGRRVRATITGGYKYGSILTSSFASNITTVVVDWDPEVYDAHAFTVAANSLSFAGTNITSLFAVDERLELWDLSTGYRKVRVIATVTFALGATVLTFDTGDPYIDLGVNDTVLVIQSAGIDNTLSEIELGLITPDLLQSGWPHNMLGGSFEIELDATTGPFAVALPVVMQDGGYIPQVQALKIVSGAPSSNLWIRPLLTARTSSGFEVTLPAAGTSGVVKYNYVILR